MCSWCFSKNMIHCTECHGFQELLPKQDETGRWAGDFSSPAGEGGGTWPWPNILGNASTCWSPFLDWPVVLSERYVFCLIVKQTFLYLYVPM